MTANFTSNSMVVPEPVYSLPEGDCTDALTEILTRHRNYVVAKAQGKLGTKTSMLGELRKKAVFVRSSKNDSEECCCALCLEQLSPGDSIVQLPCGHKFHSGVKRRGTGRSKTKGKRKIDETGNDCKGVLYWLENSSSCPQCRFSLPTQMPPPTPSESILVPLLHRQNRLIAKQSDMIKEQKKEIEELKKSLKASNGQSNSPRTRAPVSVADSNPPEGLQALFNLGVFDAGESSKDDSCFPSPGQLTWQTSGCPIQQETRKKILSKITFITLKDIIVRDTIDPQEKELRLHELAVKVEFMLYCCAPSFEKYCEEGTLRSRTLSTVKYMSDRARALKQQTNVNSSNIRDDASVSL